MVDEARQRGTLPMRLAALLFAIYVMYVLVAAAGQKSGMPLPFRLGGLVESMVFLGASVMFVVAFLQRDLGVNPNPPGFWRTLDENAERYAMLVFYVFVCAVIVQEVVRRFVLNFSSAWAEETARYAFIYLGYVGAAYAVRERAHIRFDILLQRLPQRAHGYVYIFAEVCTLLFAVIALYWSMHTVGQLLKFEGVAPVLQVNKVWFVAAVPIGFALVILRSGQAIWRDAGNLRAGRSAYTGKAMFEE